MALDLLVTFAGACALLFLKPGPAMSVIVANSVGYGVRGGLVSVAGNVIGFLLLLTIVGFGLSWLAATMQTWFGWIRLAGAIYLTWLGVSRLRNAGRVTAYGENFISVEISRRGPALWRGLCHGLMVVKNSQFQRAVGH